MPDFSDMLERLATRARQECGDSHVEVTPKVLQSLRHAEAPAEPPLTLFTIGSCAVASTVLILNVHILDKINDPLLAVFWMISAIYF